MTGQEIASIQDAIQNAGLTSTKYPKRLEIKIPRAKFPGIYLSIPTDGKSFKLQVMKKLFFLNDFSLGPGYQEPLFLLG